MAGGGEAGGIRVARVKAGLARCTHIILSASEESGTGKQTPHFVQNCSMERGQASIRRIFGLGLVGPAHYVERPSVLGVKASCRKNLEQHPSKFEESVGLVARPDLFDPLDICVVHVE